MTIINDFTYALGEYPMLKEIRPGLIFQEPLTYYNLTGDDSALTNDAYAYLMNKYGGGTVWLSPHSFVNKTTVVVPWQCNLYGHGWATVLNYTGNNAGVFMQDPALTQPANGLHHALGGEICGLVIDGANAGANAILLDTRDINGGLNLRVILRNATGASATGWQMANQNLAMNNVFGYVDIQNCTTSCLWTVLPGGPQETAIEHVNIHLSIALFAGQNGIHLANSVGIQGSRFNIYIGSNDSNAGTGIIMEAGTAFQVCDFMHKHEMNPAPGTSRSIQFNAASAKFSQCSGSMFFGPNLLTASGIAVPNTNNQFTFNGVVDGDSVLMSAMSGTDASDMTGVSISTPAVPATTVAQNNNTGTAVWVTLAGGTLTAPVKIGATNVGDTATRTFLLPSNQTITLTYSSAPTWTWQPMY